MSTSFWIVSHGLFHLLSERCRGWKKNYRISIQNTLYFENGKKCCWYGQMLLFGWLNKPCCVNAWRRRRRKKQNIWIDTKWRKRKFFIDFLSCEKQQQLIEHEHATLFTIWNSGTLPFRKHGPIYGWISKWICINLVEFLLPHHESIYSRCYHCDFLNVNLTKWQHWWQQPCKYI